MPGGAAMGQPPMGASPVGVPGANPGEQANSLAKIREFVKGMSAELGKLAPGSDEYKAVFDALGKLNKAIPPSAEVPGIQQQSLRNLQQQAAQSAPMQALMRSGGGSPGGGQPGAEAPPAAA